MKKRICFVLAAVILVASLMIFPVSAAESFTINFIDFNGFLVSNDSFPTNLSGSFFATVNFESGDSFSGYGVFTAYSENGITDFVFIFTDSVPYNFYFDFISPPPSDYYSGVVVLNDVVVSSSEFSPFTVTFEKVSKPSLEEGVETALTAVLGWMGQISTSVVSGPLSPLFALLAVAIAISVIFLVVKIVRKFAWGS